MITTNQLIAAGFSFSAGNVDSMESNEPAWPLSKTVKVQSLPYASEHIIDRENYVWPDSLAVTEVTVHGMVQMRINDAAYLEGPVPFDSEEGQSLLKDAIDAGDSEFGEFGVVVSAQVRKAGLST